MNPDFDDPAEDGAGAQAAGFDATGLDSVMDIMRGTHQVMTGAVLAGFTQAQAFQLARDWFTNMMRMSFEAQESGPK